MKEKKKRNLKKDNSYPLERYIGLYSVGFKSLIRQNLFFLDSVHK